MLKFSFQFLILIHFLEFIEEQRSISSLWNYTELNSVNSDPIYSRLGKTQLIIIGNVANMGRWWMPHTFYWSHIYNFVYSEDNNDIPIVKYSLSIVKYSIKFFLFYCALTYSIQMFLNKPNFGQKFKYKLRFNQNKQINIKTWYDVITSEWRTVKWWMEIMYILKCKVCLVCRKFKHHKY